MRLWIPFPGWAFRMRFFLSRGSISHAAVLFLSRGSNAVTRNTVKRRFRVLAKAHEESLPPHCDIVVRAKPSAASASFSSLDEQFATGFAKVARKAE